MGRLKDGWPADDDDGGGDADGGGGGDADGKWACRGDGAGGVDDAGVEQEVEAEASMRPAGGVT